MPRVKNPLPDMTDTEILRLAARAVLLTAVVRPPYRAAMTARLRQLARRVPLWIDRKDTKKPSR